MTTPAVNTGATVADVPVAEAQENAAAAAEDHTPDAVKPDPEPEGESDIPDPTDADTGLAELRDGLAAAGARIATLEETVRTLQKPDEPPVVKRPWTKRGGKR